MGLSAVISASAIDFFDKSTPRDLFNVGVRLGVNTSNRTVNKNIFDLWSSNSWGTGLDLGAVVNINFREYISVQPGFFFESRSGQYAYVSTIQGATSGDDVLNQYGSTRSYNFTIPVVVSVHLNVTDNLRWSIEAGPYLQWIMKNTVNDKFTYQSLTTAPGDDGLSKGKASNFDFGFKFGTTLDILRHYNVGVHYMAGWLHAWKASELGGHNKAWVFTIGYNF